MTCYRWFIDFSCPLRDLILTLSIILISHKIELRTVLKTGTTIGLLLGVVPSKTSRQEGGIDHMYQQVAISYSCSPSKWPIHGWYRPDLACSGTSWWGRWPDSSHPGQLARYGLKMNQNLQHHSCKDEITYIHKMLQYISNISMYCDNENLLDLYVIICTSWKECICDMCCSSQKAIQQPIHALRNQVVATVKQIE